MKTMRRKILFLSVALGAFVSSVFLTYLFCYTKPLDQSTTVLVMKPDNTAISDTLEHADSPNIAPGKIAIDQTVRGIDFKNFTYNWFPKNDNVFKKRIVLRNGENERVYLYGKKYGPLGVDYQEGLMNVSYADLTSDAKEEAVVTVGVSFYRWTPMCIFVFSEKNKKAVQIWAYETSTHDNDLDFRGLTIEDRNLVIEEFEIGTAAQCCAESVLRKTLAWSGKTFELKNLQTFPYNKEVKDYKGFPSESY
jgi:hypothetical protein